MTVLQVRWCVSTVSRGSRSCIRKRSRSSTCWKRNSRVCGRSVSAVRAACMRTFSALGMLWRTKLPTSQNWHTDAGIESATGFSKEFFRTAQCLLFSRMTKNQHIRFKIRWMLHGKYQQNVLLAALIHVYNCTNLFKTAILWRTTRFKTSRISCSLEAWGRASGIGLDAMGFDPTGVKLLQNVTADFCPLLSFKGCCCWYI